MEWRQTGFTFKVKLLTAQENLGKSRKTNWVPAVAARVHNLGKSGKTNWVHNALLIAQENLGRQKAK